MAALNLNVNNPYAGIKLDSDVRLHRSQASSSSAQTDETVVNSILQPANQTADKDSLPHHTILSAGNVEHAQSVPSKEAIKASAAADSQQSPAMTSLPTTTLRSRLRQKSTSLDLSVLAIILLAFSTWFIYIEFISEKEPPKLLKLSASHTVFTVTALSHANIYLLVPLVEQSLGALRLSLASRPKGVSAFTSLSLSGETGIFGLVDLLRVPGRHRFYCSLKLLFKAMYGLLGFVLLSNFRYATIYTPDGSPSMSVIAGLAPFNAYSNVPPSVIDIYYQMFIKGILMDVTLKKDVTPLSCSGPDCDSFVLPGGLDLARLSAGGPNSTLFQGPNYNGQTQAIIENAPGYHLEFFPITEGYVFNQTKDCTTHNGTNNEAIHICIAASGSQILAGWSICPSTLFYFGLCLNDTSWTEKPDESTVMVIHKRYTSTAYSLTNFSILDIQWISAPEPMAPEFNEAIVGNLTYLWSLIFSPIPRTFNSSDADFPTYTGSFTNYWDLSWALRLYQDDFPNYPGGPLDVLKGFLTIPIQFSTTAWQAASFGTLPIDLQTTARFSTSSERALGKLWVLIVFTSCAGILILFSVFTLLWTIIFGPTTPNSSRWPEIDTLVRSTIPRRRDDDIEANYVEVIGLQSFARQKGMGNGTSGTVRTGLQGTRLFVGVVDGAVVLAVGGEGVGRLEAGMRYS